MKHSSFTAQDEFYFNLMKSLMQAWFFWREEHDCCLFIYTSRTASECNTGEFHSFKSEYVCCVCAVIFCDIRTILMILSHKELKKQIWNSVTSLDSLLYSWYFWWKDMSVVVFVTLSLYCFSSDNSIPFWIWIYNNIFLS